MSRKLFVGNLPYSVTSERLQEAFSQFGTVSSSKVIVDRETGRSRGFAFLEMETDDQGAAAMQAMNGALLDGRSIAVREAVERQPGGGGGGGFGGGGGGGRDGGGFRPRGPRPPYGGGGGGGDRGGGGGYGGGGGGGGYRGGGGGGGYGGGGGGGGGYRGAPSGPGGGPGDGGPMRDRRADFSGGPPPAGGGFDGGGGAKSPGRSGVTAAARPTVRGASAITSRASAGSTTINRPLTRRSTDANAGGFPSGVFVCPPPRRCYARAPSTGDGHEATNRACGLPGGVDRRDVGQGGRPAGRPAARAGGRRLAVDRRGRSRTAAPRLHRGAHQRSRHRRHPVRREQADRALLHRMGRHALPDGGDRLDGDRQRRRRPPLRREARRGAAHVAELDRRRRGDGPCRPALREFGLHLAAARHRHLGRRPHQRRPAGRAGARQAGGAGHRDQRPAGDDEPHQLRPAARPHPRQVLRGERHRRARVVHDRGRQFRPFRPRRAHQAGARGLGHRRDASARHRPDGRSAPSPAIFLGRRCARPHHPRRNACCGRSSFDAGQRPHNPGADRPHDGAAGRPCATA